LNQILPQLHQKALALIAVATGVVIQKMFANVTAVTHSMIVV